MPILHRIRDYLALKERERATTQALAWLSDRQLADLGLARAQIRAVARLAAQLHTTGLTPAQLLGLLDEQERWAGTGLARRRKLRQLYRQERAAVLAELSSYSDTELDRDGIFRGSEIASLAHEEATRRVRAYLRGPAHLGVSSSA
jgi:uncharacterized protein YjiS (DUF1127 family)